MMTVLPSLHSLSSPHALPPLPPLPPASAVLTSAGPLADVAPEPGGSGGSLVVVLLVAAAVVAGAVWLIRLERKKRGPDGR
ncbi:hypothetical protein OH807_14800 [Kitasatospora sp. NBC_01560]|uniref:hypothetical protein n=1 Tax=Kitasatospora sp. NBC_01560 TaxID=2975965 RepID=UPI00386CFBFD